MRDDIAIGVLTGGFTLGGVLLTALATVTADRLRWRRDRAAYRVDVVREIAARLVRASRACKAGIEEIHREGQQAPPVARERVAGQLREFDAIYTELLLIGGTAVVAAGGRLQTALRNGWTVAQQAGPLPDLGAPTGDLIDAVRAEVRS